MLSGVRVLKCGTHFFCHFPDAFASGLVPCLYSVNLQFILGLEAVLHFNLGLMESCCRSGTLTSSECFEEGKLRLVCLRVPSTVCAVRGPSGEDAFPLAVYVPDREPCCLG